MRALVRLQLLERGLRHEEHRHVVRVQVRDEGVDGVRDRRVDRAAGLVARAEHEVVDEQLAAAVEELRQRARAVVGVEAVVLLDADPRQLASLARQLVAQPRVLLLADEQLLARGRPLLSRSDPVVGRGRVLLGQPFRRAGPLARRFDRHDGSFPLFFGVGWAAAAASRWSWSAFELAVPVPGQGGQELLRHLHGRGAKPVSHPAPLPRFGSHQPGLGQQRQVLGDGLTGDRQASRQIRRRGGPVGRECGQDRPPGRVGQGGEDLLGDGLDVRPRGIEVLDQLAELVGPALGVAVECLAVGVVGQLGEARFDDGQPGAGAGRRRA